jgi:membrane glycosyltransferase
MPVQDFWTAPSRIASKWTEAEAWQLGHFALAAAMVVFAGVVGYDAMATQGITALGVFSLVLFQVLFAWIAYALASALVGFGVSLTAPTPSLAASGRSRPDLRTAILMPVHNEDPDEVGDRLFNMLRSLRDVGAEAAFDVFILSDSRDSAIISREAETFVRLRRKASAEGRLFYRRRSENIGRKAGNIADWVRRFGGAYAYMVVLDADSVMDGDTLVRLADMMDRQPATGLIQTVPRLVNRLSLFARVQQFSSRLYGPMLSEGLAHSSGSAGNYWGHNAIIRVGAFASAAGLPRLGGPRPWGGEILSHDFIEAALLRRAGWAVHLTPELEGSFEECPPTLPDLLVRDRRWCQGNLQHLPLIGARGLHWISRLHLAKGVLTYVMPLMWILFLLTGAARSAEATYQRAAPYDDYALDMLKWLLAVSLLSLFVPRAMALFRALVRPEERAAWGSPWRLALGVVIEAAVSALLAPILMTSQSLAVVEILLGRDSGWSAQQRGDGVLAWSAALRRHLSHTLAGVALGAIAVIAAPEAALWTAPVVFGLIFSIPIAVLTSDPRIGARLKGFGLLSTPEELAPPAILSGLAPQEPQRSGAGVAGIAPLVARLAIGLGRTPVADA